MDYNINLIVFVLMGVSVILHGVIQKIMFVYLKKNHRSAWNELEKKYDNSLKQEFYEIYSFIKFIFHTYKNINDKRISAMCFALKAIFLFYIALFVSTFFII